MQSDLERRAASQGWTLQEALDRTADPKTWAAWIEARVTYEKIKKPIPSGPGAFLVPSRDLVETQRKTAIQTYNTVVNGLRDMLLDKRLVAIGSRGERSVGPTIIHNEGWRTLRMINFERSIVKEPGPRGTKIYNVRVFPLVHRDEAMAELFGCSVVEVFRKCILHDPELAAASKKLPEQHKHERVFGEGQYPGLTLNYRWPLSLTSNGLAFDFIDPGVLILDGRPLPIPPHAVVHVAEIIVDRWRRLRRRLIDGDLRARGTYQLTGDFQYVNELQWAREGLSVDVRSGDLVEFENHKPVVRWSGLSIVTSDQMRGLARPGRAASHETPMPPFDGADSASPSIVQPTKRRRPIADEVTRALQARGLDQSPEGRSFKEIAAIIGPSMRKPPKTPADVDALSKAVQRHYKRTSE